MTVLIAPLNWGLGHATRCAALVRQYIEDGHEVILGGDGESLCWLKKHFPQLRTIDLAPLTLRYGRGKSQVWAMLRALPRLIRFALMDEVCLNRLLASEPIDLVISDNRFGLYSKSTRCVYMTHQLWIRLPRLWRWLEPLVARLHARIYKRYDEVWVPDYADGVQPSLSGMLGHKLTQTKTQTKTIKYIGPLSRFSGQSWDVSGSAYRGFDTVAVLSGLEPQRSIFEKALTEQAIKSNEKTLIIRGKIQEPFVRMQHGSLLKVTYLNDQDMVAALTTCKRIICRSGYSSIMDLAVLGVLDKARLVPTPGQPEQEYLASISQVAN